MNSKYYPVSIDFVRIHAENNLIKEFEMSEIFDILKNPDISNSDKKDLSASALSKLTELQMVHTDENMNGFHIIKDLIDLINSYLGA